MSYRKLSFLDVKGSCTVGSMLGELNKGVYNLDSLELPPHGVMLDIGAHVGVFTTVFAITHPMWQVFAYEPHPQTFDFLCENLKRNDVHGVVCVNAGVTGDGRGIELRGIYEANSGGMTAYDPRGPSGPICPSVTLADILRYHNLPRIDLLKIDCEGCEHEIFANTMDATLRRLRHVVGEFHENNYIRSLGYTSEKTLARLNWFAKSLRIACIESCVEPR